MIDVAVFMTGLAGVVITAWGLVSSFLEFYALTTARRNGPRRVTAVSNILQGAFTLAAQTVVMLVGMNALKVKALPAPQAFAWTVTSAFLLAGVIVDRMRRLHLYALYDELFPEQPS